MFITMFITRIVNNTFKELPADAWYLIPWSDKERVEKMEDIESGDDAYLEEYLLEFAVGPFKTEEEANSAV